MSALCRSRRELSNEYLLAKIGVDTAENEHLEVWGKIFNIIHSCTYSLQQVVHTRGKVNLDEEVTQIRESCALSGAARV